jgi:LysM repeat protein
MLRPHDLLDLRCEAVGCRIVTGAAAPPPIVQHKVKSGETLSDIAERYYGDGNLFTLIAAANNLANPDLIRTGDVLTIPPRPAPPQPPDTYIVVPGDRLWDIAERFYGDPNKYRLIADANNLADPDLIVPGQRLIIPRLNRPVAQSRLVAVTEKAHIVVRFGVQHLFEQTYADPPGTASGVAAARAANESRVVFELPKKTEMPFTVPGVLAGLTKLALRVVPLGVPKVTGVDPRPEGAHDAPVAPDDDQTAIEAPYRLIVSPDHKYGGFAHAADPVQAPNDPSRVELWHTRLGVRTYDAQGTFVRLDEHNDELRTVRAIWKRDEKDPQPGDPSFPGSLSRSERFSIVRQTADPREKDINTGEFIEPEPLTVDRLYLSSLGAFIDWRARWDFARYKLPEQPIDVTLEAYRHLATVGRDHYVRVEKPIYFYPFGQRATLVVVTERRIDLESDPAAYLFKRMFIVLREPTRDYTADSLTDEFDGKRYPAANRLPFTATSIEPIVSPDLDHVDDLRDPFVPKIGGKPYRWKVTGIDHAKRPITMITALVAVPAGNGAFVRAFDKWWNEVVKDAEHPHPIDMGGAEVAFAPSDNPGDTTSRVQSIEFFGEETNFTCTPLMYKAHIAIPALSALNRGGDQIAVRWGFNYRRRGFPYGDKSQLYLLLDKEAKLDFAGGSDRGGGFVEPTVSVKALSRVLGGVGDQGGSPDGIDGGNYVVDKFLGTALPKLFGLLELKDILADALRDQAPKLISEQFGFVKTVQAESGALTTALQRTRDILQADLGINDAPLGAKMRFEELRNLASAALQDLAQAPVQQLVLGLGQVPPAANVATLAGDVRQVLENRVKPLVTSPYLATYLRATLERPYRALSGTLTTAMDATELGKALLAPVRDNTIRYEWFPKIKPAPSTNPIFVPKDVGRGLTIAVEVRTDKDGKPQADVSAQLRNFELELLPGDLELIRMKFGRVGFRVATGGKPEVDVQFNGMEFRGVLGFIEKLRAIIPFDGFSDPPYVDVDATSATAGFDLALPSVAIGVFSLENIALGADCRVPFLGEAVTVGFYFCTKEAPFRLTVLAIGGGGWVGIRLAPKGLVLLEMGLEAGASLSVDLGVASGSVSVMIGVYLRLEDEVGQLTAYFRIRGEVEVLGIASASITLELSLTYHFDSGKLIGRASLQVEIEVAFFSASVEITCERKLAGSKGDPTLRDIMPPDQGGQGMWNTYFDSFALTGA